VRITKDGRTDVTEKRILKEEDEMTKRIDEKRPN
jgi:hypothetical protein